MMNRASPRFTEYSRNNRLSATLKIIGRLYQIIDFCRGFLANKKLLDFDLVADIFESTGITEDLNMYDVNYESADDNFDSVEDFLLAVIDRADNAILIQEGFAQGLVLDGVEISGEDFSERLRSGRTGESFP